MSDQSIANGGPKMPVTAKRLQRNRSGPAAQTIRNLLPPETFAALLAEGKSVEEIIKPYGSRSRGYQLYYEYREQYPDLFPQKKIDRDLAVSMLQTEPLYAVARHFGVSINTLKKRMAEWNVEKVPLKDKLSADSLAALVEQFSDEDLAEKYGCSIHTIMKLRYENGIYRRGRRAMRE